MKKVFCYGLIVFKLTSEGYKFLILKSKKGHHDFPKGHYDETDQSKLACAVRETLEETGLSDLKIIQPFSVILSYVIQVSNTHKFLELFLAEYVSGDVVLSHEHTEFAWLDYEEALEILEFENSKSALISAYNFLTFTS